MWRSLKYEMAIAMDIIRTHNSDPTVVLAAVLSTVIIPFLQKIIIIMNVCITLD